MLTYILIAIVVIILLWMMVAYNGFVRQQNLVKEGWSGIDVQLKRRHDLIPNLIEAVKGYQTHEQKIFEDVANLRTQAMSATSPQQSGAAEASLTGALGKLFAIAENYPDLKASQNFLDLQRNLSDIEDQVQLARRYYNGTARDFNTRVQSFPGNLIAQLFHFQAVEFFQLDAETERAVPAVKF